MKTFTTYAEKKAKQFLNLLQECTKGIRITAFLILLLMGVTNAMANQYWYRGNKHDNWSTAKALTVSDDGYYEYIVGTYNGTHEFKICLNSSNYDNALGNDYTQSQFNNTDIWDMNSSSNQWDKGWNGNICIYENSDDTYYILVYYANTDVNTSNKPIVCAAKYLPDNSPEKNVYLKPNSNWKQQNARFAIYYWDNRGNNGWYSMLPIGCTNTPEYYSGVVPAGYSNIKFVRMNPASSTNNWDNKWNETADLKKQGGELFTIPSDTWDNSTTTWSDYTAPTYAIELTQTTGGTISISKTSPVEVDTEITVTMTPSTGYSFKSGTIKIGNNAEATISTISSTHTICGPTTITAKWEVTENKFKVTAVANPTAGGTVTPTTATEMGQNTGDKITASAKTGYTFTKWTIESGSGYFGTSGTNTESTTANTTFRPTAISTIHANFTANTYTVQFNANGGSGTMSDQAFTYGVSNNLTANAFTRTGYTFAGWATSQNGSVQYTDQQSVSNLTSTDNGTVTLYAQWKVNNYKITYTAPTHGTFTIKVGTNTPVSANTTADYKTIITLANTPAPGYHFSSWNITPSVSITNSKTFTMPANDVTIGATFAPNTYTITWNANGGTVDPATSTYIYDGDPVVLPTPKREGYTFNGWFTTSSGGTQINDVGKDNKPTSNVTYYAHWTENKHKVTISYKSGDTNLQSDETQDVGEATAVSITAPTITGYTFTGWKLGSGIVNKSANTTTNPISITTNSTGSGYTLTANYTKNSYTFKLMQAEGGNATATVGGDAITSPATLEHGTQITLTATANNKYKFNKWIDDSDAQVSTANPYTHTLTASTTIQAVFTNTDILYLKPNENWKLDDAWFAACFCKTGSTNQYWVKMKDDNPCKSNGYYKAQIPEGDWDYVIFCRMNKDQHELKWDNRWDQTTDVMLPTDEKNCYTIPEGQWGGTTGVSGTWDTYISKHQPLVYNVTVPAGTPNCYIIGSWDGWTEFIEMDKVDDTHYTITLPDACSSDGYKYCYGPSWGCEEVANTDLPTTTIADREYKSQDEVKAWIKYCLVGNDIGWKWDDDYSFDIAGDMSHNFDAKDYHIKVMSSTQKYYTHNEHPYNLHRSHTSVKIPHEGGENNQLILQADIRGTYKFNFDPVRKLLTIEFPEKGYRLKITMENGNVYTSNAVDDETDTLSFFAPGTNDPNLKGTITLERLGSTVSGFTAPTITESGVYTAKLNSAKNGITDIALYDGNYYIRTDGANGGWSNYKTDSDNKMTYFVPREEEKYSYYWVEALPRTPRNESNGIVNVKGCVANDYNDNLAVMLEADKFTSDAYGNVKIIDPDADHREKINVRFGYNPKTNHFERAMLTGSGNINTFLNIFDPLPEGYLYKTNNNGTLETRLTAASKDNKFTDISNWVYERDVWVDVKSDKDVTVCLTAVSYNGARNSLFGFDDEAQPTQRTIVGAGSTQGKKKMRVIYDFKTNRMIMAWMPDEYTCNREEALIADVLFMRHENELVPQLTITDTDTTDQIIPQIRGIQSQFFALEFENNGENNREEQYWFTLPFNSIVGSISGVPGYMTVWGIQRYDGAERAQKGWFKETETFWKWLTPNDTLKAGEGYVLSFDKSKATWNTFDVHTENEDGSVTTTQRSLLRLYFPSIAKGFTFTGQDSIVEYANEPCTIQREDRYKQDGNWKIIGPISYNTARPDSTTYETSEDSVWHPQGYTWSQPKFRYSYWRNPNNRDDWKYTPEDGEEAVYNAFFGYMVQFAGFINWSEISQSIHPRLRARTYTDQVPTNITTNLELLDAEGVQHDQTFVALNIEGTTTYDLNKDLNKVFNKNFANIYTLSEGIPFAGNTLPMEKAIVPVGVRIATAGEYTFRMPDGTDGISVTLVDNVKGTHTDMLMDEYTITLDAGTIENRFYLVVDPDRTATSVENVGEEAKGEEAKDQIKKFLIDGKLFIRTADGIFDAKGQRL